MLRSADIYQNQTDHHHHQAEFSQGLYGHHEQLLHPALHSFRKCEIRKPFDYHHHPKDTQEKFHIARIPPL